MDQTITSSDHHSTMTEAIGQVVGEAVAEVTVVEIIEVTMTDEIQIDHQSHVVVEIGEIRAHGVVTTINGVIRIHHQHRDGDHPIEIKDHREDRTGAVDHPVETRNEITFGVMIINVMVIEIVVAVVVEEDVEGAVVEAEAVSEITMMIDGIKEAVEVVVVGVDGMKTDVIVNGVVVVEEHHEVTLLHHFPEYTILHQDQNGVDRHRHREMVVVHGENHLHEIQTLPDGVVHRRLRVNQVGVVVSHLLAVVVADGVAIVLPVVQLLHVLLKNLAAVAPGVVAVHRDQIMMVVIHGVHHVSYKATKLFVILFLAKNDKKSSGGGWGSPSQATAGTASPGRW